MLYVGLALAYRDAVPLFEAPDEPSHLHYAAFVHHEGRLPRREPLEVPGEGMQPPLVYVLAAPLLAASGLDVAAAAAELHTVGLFTYGFDESRRGSARILRIPAGRQHRRFATDGSLEGLSVLRTASLAFGVLALLCTFAAVWRASRNVALASLSAALLGLNPQFLFTSAYFSNDTATVAVAAATLWVLASAIGSPEAAPARIHYLLLGALAGLGMLTKASVVPGLAVAALGLVALDGRRDIGRWSDAGLAMALALLIAGPYLLWATEHRGGPLGTVALLESASQLAGPERYGGLAAYFSTVYWDWTFESYWGRFGWFNVRVPRSVYLGFFALTWTGVLGFCAGRAAEFSRPRFPRAFGVYLAAAVGATVLAHATLNLTVASPQGRHLFASAPQLATLLAVGWCRLLGGPRRTRPLAAALTTALLLLAGYCWLRVLLPAYPSIG